MPPFLKVKTAGLPRWAWVLMLTGAAGLGLYLRSKGSTREVETDEGERLDAFEGTAVAGGLGAAGLIGPAGGQVVPVEAPYIPEGFVDMFASLTDLANQLGAYITDRDIVRDEVGIDTGGGAPTTIVDHIPPEPTTATCPTATVTKIKQNAQAMTKLQNEIQNHQTKVKVATDKIQQNPKSPNRNAWIAEREQNRNQAAAKRVKVGSLSAANSALRAIPGCNAVRV